jgi:hypothetical protein
MNSRMKNDHCTKSKPYGFYRTNWQTFCSSVFTIAFICPIAWTPIISAATPLLPPTNNRSCLCFQSILLSNRISFRARDRKIKQELFMQNASSVCFSNLQVEFFAWWGPWELTGNLQAAAAIVPYMPLARKTC